MSPEKTSQELAKAIVRAVLDPEFRQALVQNPEKTLRLAGISLTASEEELLSKLKIEDWEKLTLKDLDSRPKKVVMVSRIVK